VFVVHSLLGGNVFECWTVKGKVHPITCHEGPRGSRGLALLFL
jgi:hypothetical protein